MSKNRAIPERELAIELLKDSVFLSDFAKSCSSDLDEEDLERIIRIASVIENKAMSLFICEDDDARDLVMPDLLRHRFYEDSAEEIFKLNRFLNELRGKENEVL